MPNITIAGRVIDLATGKGVANATVEAWTQGLVPPQRLTSSSADGGGVFELQLDEQAVVNAFKDNKRILEFKVLQNGVALPIKSGDTLPVPAQSTKIEIKVELAPTPPPPPPPDTASFAIRGQVRQVDGSPLPGATVHAFDQDMRTRDPIGDGVTDDAGAYEISYSSQKFSLFETGAADLVFEVSSAQGANIPLSSVFLYDGERQQLIQGPIFNAAPEVHVDLVVQSRTVAGPSEYEQLLALLTPLMQGVNPADLTQSDIDFLSGDTQVEARIIRILNTAFQLGNTASLNPAIFYGFGREGLPLELHFLLKQGAQVLKQVLQQAITDGVIPSSVADSLDDVLKRFLETSGKTVISESPSPGVPSLASVLSLVTQDSSLHDQFWSLYSSHNGSPEEFWDKLRADPSFKDQGRVDAIQQSLQLAVLTRGSLPLVKTILTKLNQKQSTSLRALAQFGAADWSGLIDEASKDGSSAVPDSITGKDSADKKLNYGVQLQTEVDAAFPTAAIARQAAAKNVPQAKDVINFLNTNPEFEFGTVHIDSYLAQRPDALKGSSDATGARVQLKSLQRIFTITSSYPEMSVLMDGGISSARSAARLGQQSFLKMFSEGLKSADRALELYQRAERVSAIAANVYARFAPAFNSVDLNVTRRRS